VTGRACSAEFATGETTGATSATTGKTTGATVVVMGRDCSGRQSSLLRVPAALGSGSAGLKDTPVAGSAAPVVSQPTWRRCLIIDIVLLVVVGPDRTDR
jgi:hypothetical protein